MGDRCGGVCIGCTGFRCRRVNDGFNRRSDGSHSRAGTQRRACRGLELLFESFDFLVCPAVDLFESAADVPDQLSRFFHCLGHVAVEV
ncbi:hypothetical protein QQA43_31480 (plasmid) [Mycolicibacterium vanbaalenii]|nr:hypothetical protein [Mycolicibacterium vanbaalenii]WND60392.1 hypothetical protein QQA43_31480 [Mycolicibacterium vanbaalenii]